VHRHESADSALDIADGIVSIELVKENGETFGDGVYLLDARDNKPLDNAINEMSIEFSNGSVSKISIGVSDIGLTEFLESPGSLAALIEANGYTGDDNEFNYPHMLRELDKLAAAFAERFNEVH